MTDEVSVHQLSTDLRNSKYETRARAVNMLVEINTDEAYHVFIEALSEEDENVREMAALGLSQIGDERAIPHLLNSLLMKPPDYHLFTNTRDAMIHIGEPAVEPLIEALKDPRFMPSANQGDTYRHVLIGGLQGIGDKRAADPLLKLISDKDFGKDAVLALGAIGDTKAVPFLLDELERQKLKERNHIASIASTLGKLGDKRAVKPLIGLLHNDDKGIRFWAAKSLGAIGDTSAIPYLAELITDKELKVRDCAVRSLGEIGGDETIQPLRTALQDGNKKVRDRAEKALLKIGAL